jgi:hypothetical protein
MRFRDSLFTPPFLGAKGKFEVKMSNLEDWSKCSNCGAKVYMGTELGHALERGINCRICNKLICVNCAEWGEKGRPNDVKPMCCSCYISS